MSGGKAGRQLRRAGLVIVGDEILQGRRTDKHFSHARDFLAETGIDVAWVYYLGDDLGLLADHFEAMRRRGDVCFSFGGIGATPDDQTRQAMARAHGGKLVRHPEALRLIEKRFGAEAYPNRVLMADLPENCTLIPNEHNDIPGFSVGDIHCLPGFPNMAWAMLRWVVEHCYGGSERPASCYRSFVVVDVRESELIPLLERLQARHPEVRISSLPRFPADGNWQTELGVRGIDPEVARVLSELSEEVTALGYAIDGSGGPE